MTVEFELQMWMNVLKALVIAVMIMQLATILMETTPALAILDTQAMDLCVLVSSSIVFLVNYRICQIIILVKYCTLVMFTLSCLEHIWLLTSSYIVVPAWLELTLKFCVPM